MSVFVLASTNPGKIKEFHEILNPEGIRLLPQTDFIQTDVEETGFSFIENAILKARYASKHSHLPAIADDSGLEIDALQGEPGIYSARYAGEEKSSDKNIQKVLTQLQSVGREKRSARFVSVIALMRHEHDPDPFIFRGYWEGEILQAPQGTGGFGYDSIFYVPTHHCSAAELPTALKNKLSHRAKALEQFRAILPLLKGV